MIWRDTEVHEIMVLVSISWMIIISTNRSQILAHAASPRLHAMNAASRGRKTPGAKTAPKGAPNATIKGTDQAAMPSRAGRTNNSETAREVRTTSKQRHRGDDQ